MRKAIRLIDITTEGLLLVDKKGVYILPGGKSENGEGDYGCLIRKLTEELSVAKEQIKIYNFYNSFIGKNLHNGGLLENRVYFGAINCNFKASAEISKAKHIKDFENYKISEITSKIIFSLKKDKYL